MQYNYEIERDTEEHLYMEIIDKNWCNTHYHKCIELVYVINGEHDVTISGKHTKLQQDEIGFSNPYETHEYHYNKTSNVVILVIPNSYLIEYHNLVGDYQVPSFLLDKEKNKVILPLLTNLFSCYKKNNPLIIKGYINLILGSILQNYTLIKKVKNGYNDLVLMMLTYIEKNYNQSLSLEELSYHFKYSKTYLMKVFQKSTNLTIQQFINGIRIQKAAYLLTATDDSILDISLNCGFSSLRTFYRVFHEFYLTSPKNYRKSK